MKRILVTALTTLFCAGVFGQSVAIDTTAPAEKKKAYWLSTSELILSGANVENKGVKLDNIVRFSAFFHAGQQVHFDFSENAGFYTGISLRNIGMINDLNDSVRIKQRVYTLGVPAAFKLGNMKGFHIALGAEAEFAIAFKQKVFVNDEKSKTTEWFSDRTNIFLPSTFAEIRTKQGGYIKFKYYLSDFLVEGKQKVNGTTETFVPNKSQLFYVSFGYALNSKAAKATYKNKI